MYNKLDNFSTAINEIILMCYSFILSIHIRVLKRFPIFSFKGWVSGYSPLSGFYSKRTMSTNRFTTALKTANVKTNSKNAKKNFASLFKTAFHLHVDSIKHNDVVTLPSTEGYK